MPEYLYQIKCREMDERWIEVSGDKWHWPPVQTGKISAGNKKEAQNALEEMTGHALPMRVSAAKYDRTDFLLHLREIKAGDDRTASLFLLRPCKECGQGFRVIDLYNDHCERYKGFDYCSYSCSQAQKERLAINQESARAYGTVIYRIYNKQTQKSYIGRTSQAFTLRWWQHFAHPSGTPFHDAIKESNIEDWTFEIVERVEKDADAAAREQHWIDHYDALGAGGYNSAIALKNANQTEMEGF